MNKLKFDERFNRTTRTGSWNDLKTGTFALAQEAFALGHLQEGIELSEFFVTEARILFGIYTQWLPDIRRCMIDKGIDTQVLADEEAKLAALISSRYPDILQDRTASWQRVENDLAQLQASGSCEEASTILHRMRVRWRELHDSEVDYIAGQLDVIIRYFGEPAIGEMYEGWVIGDWFEKRYSKFDVSKHQWAEIFDELVYLSFESMHGHLSGPERVGSVDFEDCGDRVTLSFAPCGSGGRTLETDSATGRPSLMGPPFNFGTLHNPHDFSWNTPGICPYCAHCCVILEKLPAERFGYPVRVVDPPVYDPGKASVCSWTIYRNPRDVPEHVYERIGKSKPPAHVPLGSEGLSKRDSKKAAASLP